MYLEKLRISSRYTAGHLGDCSRICSAEKCEFHVSQVFFLGFVLNASHNQVDPDKVKGVSDCWVSHKQLQQFLGFANWQFIRSYRSMAAPLTPLTSVYKAFSCSIYSQQALNQLESLLSSAPILSFQDPSKQFLVEVDVSDTRLLAIKLAL